MTKPNNYLDRVHEMVTTARAAMLDHEFLMVDTESTQALFPDLKEILLERRTEVAATEGKMQVVSMVMNSTKNASPKEMALFISVLVFDADITPVCLVGCGQLGDITDELRERIARAMYDFAQSVFNEALQLSGDDIPEMEVEIKGEIH
jgi:hypothetical protein